VLLGYALGIFPWYHDGLPILWHSPDPRMVLEAGSLRVARSLRKQIRRERYTVRMDTAFDAVVDGCASTPRPNQSGTWLVDELRATYGHLHRLGFAHSIEAWRGDELVGGLYGVSLGGAFFGESMYAREPDASKVAFVALVEQLQRWDIWLIDCQVYTAHLSRFGAELWPRARYLAALRDALARPTRLGAWELDRDV
jgi:leucyl/phenylalanyl-tRNA--protein transferase